MQITKPQISAIKTLLSKAGLADQQDDIVNSFTGNRTGRVSQMNILEAKALIGHLKAKYPALDAQEKDAFKMKNKILAMAHEMGWHLPGTKRISMAAVNIWMRRRSYLHKDLDKYTYAELPRLVSQFEAVYKSYLNSIAK